MKKFSSIQHSSKNNNDDNNYLDNEILRTESARAY